MLRKVFATVAFIAGGIASLVTVGAFFGGFWWGFDLVANYRWQWMWLALGASIVYALSGKGFFTGVFLAAAAVNMWLILPVWIGSQPSATGENVARVVHIDVSGTVGDMAAVTQWLLDTDADLLLIAGITSDQVPSIALPDSPYMLLSGPGAETGVAIYGRDRWTLDVRLSEDGQRVQRVTVPTGAGVVDVVTAWGAMGTSQSASDAVTQRFATVADVVAESTNPVAVVANLGATKWTETSRNLMDATSLRDATEGSGYLSTWPLSNLPVAGRWIGIPIDVVYMEPELTPLAVIVGPDIGAEHLPLTIDISPVAEDI